MTLYPSKEEWAIWGIQGGVQQAFCLHWFELFDPETPDTWQVRTCNIKTILNELLDASQIAGRRDAYRGVMRSILDEAFAVIARDSIVKHSYPFVSTYLEPWRDQDVGEKAVPQIERVARVVLGNLGRYWERGVEILRNQLVCADGSRMKDLYATTMNVAVETAARGRSSDHILQRFQDIVLVPASTPFLDRFDKMFLEFATLKQHYKCRFSTVGIKLRDGATLPEDVSIYQKANDLGGGARDVPPVQPDLGTGLASPSSLPEQRSGDGVARQASPVELPIAAIDVGPAPYGGEVTGARHKTQGRGVALMVAVDAADPMAARHIAEKRLGEFFAAKNLFDIEHTFGIRGQDAVVEDMAGGETVVGPRRLGSHYLGDYDSRLLKVEMLLRVQQQLQRVSPSDASQMSAAIEFHRLALMATSDEARLLNLWIALEALCQKGEGSIIDRIWSKVAPCVAIDNVKKTLVSLSIFLRNLWNDDSEADFAELFPKSKRDYLRPEDLARVLLLPNGDPQQKSLCKLCSNHPLLRHRLFRAQSMMLADPTAVAGNIEYTCKNVEWQLKRIYRVRNAIVHTGSSNMLLPQLTQHLHSYLVKTIHSILIDLDQRPYWTISESLEHRLRLFEHNVRFYKKTKGHEIGMMSLFDPEACLLVQESPFAWPPPPPESQAPAHAGKVTSGQEPSSDIKAYSPPKRSSSPPNS